MSKKVMAVVAVVALVAILGICLVACNAESVSKKLEKKDYTVSALSEKSTGFGKSVYNIVKGVEGFDQGVVAVNSDGDSVAVVWFDSTDAAKDFETNKLIATLSEKVSRVGKVVYVGTEQGVKDAK